jgi:hypothetical protein
MRTKYPELTYDPDRNMIIMVHYISAFDRYSRLPNEFKCTHEQNYNNWKTLIDMKNISVPILHPTILELLSLSSKERELFSKLMNDPEIIYTALNEGGWYEYFMGSPALM